MFKNTLGLPDLLHDYILDNSLKELPILAELRQETEHHKQARMQISPDQGQLIALLIRLMSARRVLEIGVFTGYSSLTIALALPTDGVLVACDISEEYTAIAKRYWRQAGVQDKIDLRIAPALQTLDSLLESGQAETFDFAFVDADKANYSNYYDRALKLLRPGGLMAMTMFCGLDEWLTCNQPIKLSRQCGFSIRK
jgi:predicted O-methyltransferase YrrM